MSDELLCMLLDKLSVAYISIEDGGIRYALTATLTQSYQTQHSWRLFPNINCLSVRILFLQRGYQCGIAIPENENTNVKFGYISCT